MPLGQQSSGPYDPQYKPVVPTGGIDTSIPPELLPENKAVDIVNLLTIQRSLQVDTGYQLFGAAVVGTPQRSFNIAFTNGLAFTLLVTTATCYFLDASNRWTLPDDGVSTTLTGIVNSGNVFPFTSVTGFNVNDLIGITLDDGSQLQTTVTAINSLNVTTLASVPASRHANNGAQVVHAPKLAGDLTKHVDGQTSSANNWFVFTNGVDHVKYFDGTHVQDIPNLVSAGVTACRDLIIWNNHLVLLDTTEGGTRKPQRVRRSSNTDITNWTTGNSGYNDLTETSDVILAASVIGPYLIIYRANNIMRTTYTSDPTQLFFFEYAVRNVGLLAPGCAVQTGGSHDNEVGSTGGADIIASPAGIFKYSGGFDLQPIGEQIFYTTIAQGGNLNIARQSLSWLIYIQPIDEVWFGYASAGNQYPDTVLRYNMAQKTWHKRKFANSVLSLGFFVTSSSLTWAADTTRWIDKNFSWDSQMVQSSSPTLLMCSADIQQVFQYDFQSTTDNGAAISWSYTTKDFIAQDKKITFDAFVGYGRGTALVEISTDRGRTWQTIGTIDFGVSPSQARVDKQITDDFFRLRLSGTDPAFQLSWFTPKYYEGSPW